MKTLIILLLLTFFLPQKVFAQDVPPAGIRFDDLMSIGTRFIASAGVGIVIQALLPYIFGLAGFLILLFIILGGFQILTSQNDPKAIAAGQQKIYYAIIGFIVVFTAFWITQLVANILDLEPIIDIFPS